MTIFEEEVREKTILARSAHHRHRPPRTPKINNLSDARWREMNGEVMSFELGKPMSWQAYKALPENYQIQYTRMLVDKYSVGPTALAEMFGVNSMTVSKYIKEKLGVALPKYSSGKRRMTFINEFCSQVENGEALSDVQGVEDAALPVDAPVKPRTMLLTKTALSFSGPYSAKLIADKLSALFDDGVDVTVTIDIHATE